MSRVIKFRGFDPVKKEFRFADICETDEMSEWITWENPIDSPSNTGVGFDIDQFTGLTDLDCVEMYADDIAYVEGLGNCLVKICPHYGVVFCDHVGQEVPVVDCLAERDDFKIVGNIHQHPELLK